MAKRKEPDGPGTEEEKVVDLFPEPAVQRILTPEAADTLVDDERLVIQLRGYAQAPDRDALLPFRSFGETSRLVIGPDGEALGISSLRAIEAKAVKKAFSKVPMPKTISKEMAYTLADKMRGIVKNLRSVSHVFSDDSILKQLEFDLVYELTQALDSNFVIDPAHLEDVYNSILQRLAQLNDETGNVRELGGNTSAKDQLIANLPKSFAEFTSVESRVCESEEIKDSIEAAAESVILGTLDLNKVVLAYRLRVKSRILGLLEEANYLAETTGKILAGVNSVDLLDMFSLDDQALATKGPIGEIIITSRGDIRQGELRRVRDEWASRITSR